MKKILLLSLLFLSAPAFAYYTQTIQNKCGTMSELRAIFTINTYTCAAGYFLPANTLGCKPCPSDHVCSGGTFEFNPHQSQGIQYKTFTRDASYTCSSNAPHIMSAIFTPNTIGITYYANGEQYDSGTCVYDDEIILPSTPTRPGYIFNGWRIRQ